MNAAIGKLTAAYFEERKIDHLADDKAEALMNGIHKEMVFNWDQTGLQLVPTGHGQCMKQNLK